MVLSLGDIDASTVATVVKEVTEEQKKREVALAARPPVENVLNLHEFEIITKAVIPEKAWVRSARVVCDVILTLPILQGILLLCIRR